MKRHRLAPQILPAACNSSENKARGSWNAEIAQHGHAPTATARRINGVNEEVSEQATRKKAAHQQTQPSNRLRRTNDNSPLAHDTSSTRNPRHLDDELTELQKRLAEHERREHEIIKRERQLQLRERELAKQAHHNEATACRERVEVLRKPKGEAGDSKRGFQLQDAMGLGDSEDGDMRYNEFLNRMAIPYLTRERFPNDWLQVEALKQYIRNARRGIARKQRGRTENRKKRNADDAEGEDDADETSARDNPPNADATLTRWMRMEPPISPAR
ncbi:hypothetical protein HGRIS_008864 [Hohenbuehelia grisea]|uniref:Uncharacterized protein n=1 Tax=Hohenbuehelia grisea TaxID=104357 RepID=A0ABR3J0S5_9AGAR